MKTFRLVSFQCLEQEQGEIVHLPIPLKEGLIINREEKDGSWLINAVIDRDQENWFIHSRDQENPLVMEVTITDPRNEPAIMTGTVMDESDLSEGISLLIKAKMAGGQEDVSQMILEDLAEEGYTGPEMIKEFQVRKKNSSIRSAKMAQRIFESFRREN